MKSPVVFVIIQTESLANGGLQSITEVMRRLKEHRPIILTNLESEWTRSWQSHGFDVQVVPEDATGGSAANPIRAIRKFRAYRRYHSALCALLKTSGARVVHANDPFAIQLSASAARLPDRVRIALNLRDTLDPARVVSALRRFKYRLMFDVADHVFYLSNDMAERWRQLAENAMRACSVTYSIVDPERFPASPPSSRETPVVLVSGIFWPKKGQLEFIRNVVPLLAARGIETWFAGDFEPECHDYSAACSAAAERHSSHVRFLGYRSDMPDLLRQASVVAVPSRHEGLMRGMIEAMSIGRPVVTFDVCSAREVLEDWAAGAGVVVPMGDYERMAASLVHFASNRNTQASAGQVGIATARFLFDPDAVVERYERVYRELGSS
jgi:glycosyltransferase involved in cell wall biosynthesis